MKQLKPWLCGLLALVLVLGLLPGAAHAASGQWGESITWTLDKGVLTLSGTGEMAAATPEWDRNELESTDAPWFGMDVTKVIVKEGITSVGAYAFAGMTKLQSAVLPESLTVIGWDAFMDCTALKTVNLPSKLVELGSSAFENCKSLTGPIVLPEGVMTLESNTFYGCESLRKVVLPENLAFISTEVFFGSGIEEITIPAATTGIFMFAFANCRNLKAIHVAEGNPMFASDAQGALYNKELTTLYTLPGGYSGTYTMPDSLEYLDHNWSAGCHALKNLEINAIVTDLGSGALADCENLDHIEVDRENPVFRNDVDGILYATYERAGGSYTHIIRVPALYQAETAFHVGENLTGVGENAFWHCRYLTDIYLPEGLKDIEYGAFYGCEKLTGIWFSENHPEYRSDDEGVVFSAAGDSLVFFPTGRTGYYAIPEGVENVEALAFASGAIGTVRFPESLRKLYMGSFNGCENLTDVLFTGEQPRCYYDDSFLGLTLNVYYPGWLESWVEPDLGAGNLTYIPYAEGEEPDLSKVVVNPFTDVKKGDWFADPVFWAIEKGITNGVTATTFAPDDTCSRDQIATFLWRANGCPEPASSNNPFTDVKNDQWYTKAVLWALEKGITTGATATTFGTEDPCERAAVVTFLWRAFGCPEPTTTKHPFTDADANAWYGKAMLWAVENGITSGITATTFGPTQTCTRAQIVTFLYRAYNK